jgi:hypothetical protein
MSAIANRSGRFKTSWKCSTQCTLCPTLHTVVLSSLSFTVRVCVFFLTGTLWSHTTFSCCTVVLLPQLSLSSGEWKVVCLSRHSFLLVSWLPSTVFWRSLSLTGLDSGLFSAYDVFLLLSWPKPLMPSIHFALPLFSLKLHCKSSSSFKKCWRVFFYNFFTESLRVSNLFFISILNSSAFSFFFRY